MLAKQKGEYVEEAEPAPAPRPPTQREKVLAMLAREIPRPVKEEPPPQPKPLTRREKVGFVEECMRQNSPVLLFLRSPGAIDASASFVVCVMLIDSYPG